MQTILELPFVETERKLANTAELWGDIQTRLSKVDRFYKYRDLDYEGIPGYPGVREQDSLQHVVSVEFIAHIVLLSLKPFFEEPVDEGLVLRAINLHEIGEMEKIHLQRLREGLDSAPDTHYIDKNVIDDGVEYELFLKRVTFFPKEIREAMQRAFLLQFALKDSEKFSSETRAIMSDLREENPVECLLFQVIERWDYLMYALEQYINLENEVILLHVLRNQFPHLDNLSCEVPGFGTMFWTESRRGWFDNFMREYDGEWIEKSSK